MRRFSTDALIRDRATRLADGGHLCDSGSGGFQTAVSGVPSPGVVGDFADSNPRQRVLGGPGGLVSGGGAYGANAPIGASSAGSAIVGRFGWLSQQAIDPDNAATIVNSFYSPGGGMQTARAR